MASREEEKKARREARLAQEAKEAKAAARNKRLQLVLGGVLAALIVVGVVIGITASGGDDDSSMSSGGNGAPAQAGDVDVTLPEPQIVEEQAAAEAAGCTIDNPPNEGAAHEEKVFTAEDYDQNPPTSGPHFPSWAQDGIYEAGKEPQIGELVHTLEHGRIDVQYKEGTSPEVVEQLTAFVGENNGYHMLLFQNPTGMEPAIAATAWDWSLTCPEVNDKVWDALRTFRDAHVDRGPEKVP